MKEINISLITGQLITLLPIWEIDSRLEYITLYIGATLLIYLLILAVKKKPCSGNYKVRRKNFTRL